MSSTDDYRALVCITTCKRLGYLRRYVPHFAQHCSLDRRFNLLVSLDGNDSEVLEFCEEWELPLVYSDAREGVGLAKNRALERFPDFDYYFFLEDDVELVDGRVFAAHVEMSRESGIHHFSLFARGRARKPVGQSMAAGRLVTHCLYGDAHFNFFTADGLRRVGGWHPRFAAYRRWGHTEHSYRFQRAGLAPAPFNVAEELDRSCIWHVHPPVTRLPGVPLDDDEISEPERALMDEKLAFAPLETIAPHHFNGVPFGRFQRLAGTLTGNDRYPLIRGSERRRTRSDYYAWKSATETGNARRLLALMLAVVRWPGNPAAKDVVKAWIRR